jgi:hypothetical protein
MFLHRLVHKDSLTAGWPIQAFCWLEWGSFRLSQTLSGVLVELVGIELEALWRRRAGSRNPERSEGPLFPLQLT